MNITPRSLTCWDRLPEVMDVKQTAIVLNVHPATLRRMARNGDVPAHKLGPVLWRFYKSELMKTVPIKEAQ